MKIFAPGILDSLRQPTPPARRDDTWPVTVARLANGRVQWVNLLSASAVAGPSGGFASILALRTPNSLIQSPSCSCQHSFLFHRPPPPPSPLLQGCSSSHANPQTLVTTESHQADISGSFCSPVCCRPTPEEPISRHKHSYLTTRCLRISSLPACPPWTRPTSPASLPLPPSLSRKSPSGTRPTTPRSLTSLRLR